MKAIILERYGKKGSVRLGEMPEPELRDDEVLVKVHAAGVNLLDSKIKSGKFKLILPYAEAAAVVLTSENQASRVYELAGDTSYTLKELAAEISRQSGKNIGYVNLPESEYKGVLVKVGLPEVIAELLANSDTGASKGALFDDSRQLSTLIGRVTTPLATTIAAMM